MSLAAPPRDADLVWGIALAQMISWGTLYTSFPVFLEPMEAELGWSRAALNGALTAGLLVAGLVAIPAGRWVDRHGGRLPMTAGALAGAALLALWALVESPWQFYALWIGIGAVQALTLSDPAYAVVLANARDPRRTIAGITFVTGFCSTVFLPVTALLTEALGWRGALLVLAALQLLPAAATAFVLRGERPGVAARSGEAAPAPLGQVLRRPEFWGLATCFCAVAFVGTGLSFHMIPLLTERGLPLAAVLTVIALHGPCQVGARAVLFAAGARASARVVGRIAAALLPLAMAVLALAGAEFALLVLYAVCWGVANGLLVIVRATGVAEILGRAGYGQVSGALTTAAVLPRTAAPLALAVMWEAGGGYGAVPWVLLAVALVGMAGFWFAARRG